MILKCTWFVHNSKLSVFLPYWIHRKSFFFLHAFDLFLMTVKNCFFVIIKSLITVSEKNFHSGAFIIVKNVYVDIKIYNFLCFFRNSRLYGKALDK